MINLGEKIILEAVFSWDDVVNCMSDDERELYNSIEDEQKERLVEKYSGIIGKGLQAGTMYDWEYVMRTAISNTNMYSRMKKLKAENMDVVVLEKAKDVLINLKKILNSVSDDSLLQLTEDATDCPFLSNYEISIEDAVKEIEIGVKLLNGEQ